MSSIQKSPKFESAWSSRPQHSMRLIERETFYVVIMLLFSTEAVGSSLETRLQLSSSSILYVVDNDQGVCFDP